MYLIRGFLPHLQIILQRKHNIIITQIYIHTNSRHGNAIKCHSPKYYHLTKYNKTF